MEDSAIVDLYWQRNDSAISETTAKYGAYCHAIAFNILKNIEDADESVNDTWLKAWNSMPPQRPGKLSAFLGRITRNLSISRLRSAKAKKRAGICIALDELREVLPADSNPVEELEAKELGKAIALFLSRLEAEQRSIFVSRYWYLAEVDEIARATGSSPSRIRSILHRTRLKLKDYLREEELC